MQTSPHSLLFFVLWWLTSQLDAYCYLMYCREKIHKLRRSKDDCDPDHFRLLGNMGSVIHRNTHLEAAGIIQGVSNTQQTMRYQ